MLSFNNNEYTIGDDILKPNLYVSLTEIYFFPHKFLAYDSISHIHPSFDCSYILLWIPGLVSQMTPETCFSRLQFSNANDW